MRSATRSAAQHSVARLALLLLLMPLANAYSDTCSETFCISEKQQDGLVIITAENTSAFPVTYTLGVRGQNLRMQGPRKLTRTLAPRSSATATSFALVDSIVDSVVDSTGNTIENASTDYKLHYRWTIGDKNALHNENHVYRLPYADGKSYRVIQGFGSRFSHTGLEQFAIDFLMPEGTPIHAARDGVVAKLEESNTLGCWEDGCGRHANYVVILHDDGTTGEYYHLLKDGVLVNVGDRVRAGQKIALSGNTGHTTVAHLHFAVYRAVEWGNTQSVPVRFVSADGIVHRPRRGGRYQAVTMPANPAPAVARPAVLGAADE